MDLPTSVESPPPDLLCSLLFHSLNDLTNSPGKETNSIKTEVSISSPGGLGMAGRLSLPLRVNGVPSPQMLPICLYNREGQRSLKRQSGEAIGEIPPVGERQTEDKGCREAADT